MAAFPAPDTGVARADQVVVRAVASAYLGRYRGQTRLHTESDLRVFLSWCTDQRLDPLAAVRADIERYVRWLQDVRRYQPSTVSRRLSIVVGFYRVCVIDQILAHSPADYVRRPTVAAESPTLGLGHLQFEALITTARLSTNPNDFALVALLGLLGLRIFEACGANIGDLGEEHGHRVLRCVARAARSSWCRCHLRWPGPSTWRSMAAPTARSCATPSARGWTATPPPAGSSTWPPPPACGCRGCTHIC
jgi:integrase/recombinase XerD